MEFTMRIDEFEELRKLQNRTYTMHKEYETNFDDNFFLFDLFN